MLKAAEAVRVAFIEPDYTGASALNQPRNKEYDTAARGLGIGLLTVPLKIPQGAKRDHIRSCVASDAMLIDDGATTFFLRRELADFAFSTPCRSWRTGSPNEEP